MTAEKQEDKSVILVIKKEPEEAGFLKEDLHINIGSPDITIESEEKINLVKDKIAKIQEKLIEVKNKIISLKTKISDKIDNVSENIRTQLFEIYNNVLQYFFKDCINTKITGSCLDSELENIEKEIDVIDENKNKINEIEKLVDSLISEKSKKD